MATFGSVNSSGTLVSTSANNKDASKFTLDAAGSVVAVVIKYSSTPTGKVKAIIYDNTGVGGLPGALKGTSVERTSFTGPQSNTEITFTFSPGVTLAASDFWLGQIVDTANSTSCSALTAGIKGNANTYTNGPSDPFGASPSSANFVYPIFAIYTPTLTAGTFLGTITGADDVGSINYLGGGETVFAVTAPIGGTISAITFSIRSITGIGSAKYKGVIYDNTGTGGNPGALLGTSTELVGPALNQNVLSFSSPVRIAAGVNYIGIINDTATPYSATSSTACGFSQTRTYASGPANPFSASPTQVNNLGMLWATFTPDIVPAYRPFDPRLSPSTRLEPIWHPPKARRYTDPAIAQPAPPGGYRKPSQAQDLRAPPWHPKHPRRYTEASIIQPPTPGGHRPLPQAQGFREPPWHPKHPRRYAEASAIQPAPPGGYRPHPQPWDLRAPPWHPRAQRRSFDVSTAQPPSGPAPLPRHPAPLALWHPAKRRPGIDPASAQPFIGPYPPPRRRFAAPEWHPPKRRVASFVAVPAAIVPFRQRRLPMWFFTEPWQPPQIMRPSLVEFVPPPVPPAPLSPMVYVADFDVPYGLDGGGGSQNPLGDERRAPKGPRLKPFKGYPKARGFAKYPKR